MRNAGIRIMGYPGIPFSLHRETGKRHPEKPSDKDYRPADLLAYRVGFLLLPMHHKSSAGLERYDERKYRITAGETIDRIIKNSFLPQAKECHQKRNAKIYCHSMKNRDDDKFFSGKAGNDR